MQRCFGRGFCLSVVTAISLSVSVSVTVTATAGAEQVVGRSEFSTTVAAASGARTTHVSPVPMNFRDASGAWREVDTSLEPVGGGVVAASAIEGEVRVPSTAGGRVVVGDGRRELSLRLIGASGGERDVEESTATFSGVMPGVSTSYTATARGVKEVVRLSESATRVLRYDVRVPSGWEIDSAGQGRLLVRDGARQIRFEVTAPVAWDSAADAAYTNALELSAQEQSDGRWTVTLKPDAQWLDDPARVWPVFIDPDVQTATVYSTADSDCFLASGSQADDNFCDLGVMKTGYDSRTYKSLVKYDLSSIPASATVTAANMVAFQTLPASNLPYPQNMSYHTLRTLTSSWDPETVTWNKRNATTNWGTAGGDVSGESMLTSPYSMENFVSGTGIYQLSVPLAAVKGWVDGTVANYGFQLAAAGSAVIPFEWATYETTLPAPEVRRPRLSITWEPSEEPDTTAPEPPSHLLFGSLDEQTGNLDVWFDEGEDPEPNPSGLDRTEARVKVNDGTFTAWGPATSPYPIIGLESEDAIELELRSVDAAGNFSEVVNFSYEANAAPNTDAFDAMAGTYVEDEYDVSPTIAQNWLDTQSAAAEMDKTLRAHPEAKDHYVGYWLDNDARIVHFQTKDDPNEEVADEVSNWGISSSSVVDTVTLTPAEISDAAETATSMLTAEAAAGQVVVLHSTSSWRGVTFEYPESASPATLAAIEDARDAVAPVPSRVIEVEADQLGAAPTDCHPADRPGCNPPVRGGMQITRFDKLDPESEIGVCTVGFNVLSREDSLPYMLTAGHCLYDEDNHEQMQAGEIKWPEPGGSQRGTLMGTGHSFIDPNDDDADAGLIAIDAEVAKSGIPPWVLFYDSSTGSVERNPHFTLTSARNPKPGEIVCYAGGFHGSRCGEVNTDDTYKGKWRARFKICSDDDNDLGGDSGSPVVAKSSDVHGVGVGVFIQTEEYGINGTDMVFYRTCTRRMQLLPKSLDALNVDLVTAGYRGDDARESCSGTWDEDGHVCLRVS